MGPPHEVSIRRPIALITELPTRIHILIFKINICEQSVVYVKRHKSAPVLYHYIHVVVVADDDAFLLLYFK